MKGISPIIATILLIVMTVAIAGLMYAWLTGMFSSLTASSSTQMNKLTQLVSFYIPSIYPNGSSTLEAVIYNDGNVPINTASSSFSIIAQEMYPENNTYDGVTYTCTVSNGGTIAPGQQATISLSCSGTNGGTTSNITSNVESNSYYYLFTFTYEGVSVTAQLT